MESVVHTFQQALRGLTRQPRLVGGVLMLLTLGIGSTTAIFNLVSAALLAELPYPNPDRVVRLATFDRSKDLESRVSYPDFEDWRAGATSFEAMGAAGDARLTVTGGSGTESLIGQYVSDDYLQILGGVPRSGRRFDKNETDIRSGVRAVVILSHGYWQRGFGSDPQVLGKTLQTTVGAFEIVGVMNPDFVGLLERADFWIPASASKLIYPGWVESRTRRWHRVVARLKPGVSVDAARSELALVAERTSAAFPASHSNLGVRTGPLDEAFRAQIGPGLFLLMGGALFLLAIACANVAHLMLVRVQGRRGEIALRAALGSSRHRVIGLLLAESLILSLGGGAFGLLLATLMSQAILGLGAIDLPRYVRPELDATVFGGALFLTLLTCIGFGLVPALTASKVDLRAALMSGAGRGQSGRTSRLTRALVVGQVAVSLTLLVGASLLFSSLTRLQRFDPGFNASDLLAFEINPGGPKYQQPEAQREFARALDERLKRLSGVQASIVAPHLPPRLFWPLDVRVEGRSDLDPSIRLEMHSVSSDFFGLLGVPLRAGRLFTTDDHPRAPRAAVISESTARRLWPGQDPMGKRLRAADSRNDADWLNVVGVVGDVKYDGIRSPRGPDLDIYFPIEQFPSTYMTIAVRTDLETGVAAAMIRRELLALDPALPVLAVSTIAERFARERSATLLQASLLGLFATVAFVLAAAGLYSAISYSVSRRTREMSIRSALGASPGQLIRMVLGEGALLTGLGLALGLAAALLLSFGLRGLLFGVSALDPVAFGAPAALLGLAAVIACLVPARIASRINPGTALGAE
jgi:putative ABC transport system permease protein